MRGSSALGASRDASPTTPPAGFFGRMKLAMYYGRDWSGASLEYFMKAIDNCLVRF